MVTTKSEMVKGDIEPATRDGFVALLKKANDFLASEEGKDYRLLTIVRLEKAITAIYTRGSQPKGPTTTEVWPEDDNEV
jgi:hypothetical protein